ncbi:MAG: hypothetical protein FJ088_00395 [Deltaproteobacteria bacterium]|nr:hypothetical protein [Deltaproteobacteria bacterium]
MIRRFAKRSEQLLRIYELLSGHYGNLGWWPGETPFEMMVLAVLTQNTAWSNVEKAIANLKSNGVLSPEKLLALAHDEIASMIKPAGYFNVKTKRLTALLEFFRDEYSFSFEKMASEELSLARLKLLNTHGVGGETADSILLYCVNKPVFVIDAYTRRILKRLGIADGEESYEDLQGIFMRNLPADPALFNDYHAQFVIHGKTMCRTKPLCAGCPIAGMCSYNGKK